MTSFIVDPSHPQASGRELLTVMDETGCMWQISIEGSKVKVVNGQPTQVQLYSSKHVIVGSCESCLYLDMAEQPNMHHVEGRNYGSWGH